MFREIIKQIRTALALLILMTITTGFIYPMAVTLFAQYFFPWEANGSLLKKNGVSIGSVWIGQSFTTDTYFWGRPSATQPYPYNGASSSGSNSGPSNPNFLANVYHRVTHLQKTNDPNVLIPVGLVTASGSGLDPEISPAAAVYQIPRIAKARHLVEDELQALIIRQTKNRLLGLFGEPRINVLTLNLELDNLSRIKAIQ